MMGFKNRLVRASGYRDADFFNADSIGVIGRGSSVHRLDLCYKQFDHCFLAGEFNHTLHRIDKYIRGKKLVLCIMQQDRYRTTEENCREFGINNMQIGCQEGTDEHKKYISKFPDLKVNGFSKRHYDIVEKISGSENVPRSIFSTGMAGIISALYFNPKCIYIIGLDFYDKNVKPYFMREDRDIPHIGQIEKSIKGLRSGMIETINNICDNFKDIDLYLYTTYRGIGSRENLHIKYV